MSSNGVPLDKVKEWPEEYVRRLKECWITTVEQVIATSARPEGLRTLAQYLELSEEETRRLIVAARKYLPPEVAAELERPVDVSQYGLGALEPKKVRKE